MRAFIERLYLRFLIRRQINRVLAESPLLGRRHAIYSGAIVGCIAGAISGIILSL